MKTYQVAKPYKMFMCFGGFFFLAAFNVAPVFLLRSGEFTFALFVFVEVAGLFFIVISVLAILGMFTLKVMIDEDRIIVTDFNSRREAVIGEMKGFRVFRGYIHLFPVDKKKTKKITISEYLSQHDRNEIIAWLNERIPNIDGVAAQEEKQKILENADFGWTKEIRETRLAKAHKAAKFINRLSLLIAVWCAFIPFAFRIKMCAAMAMPVVALLAIVFSNGLIGAKDRLVQGAPSVLTSVWVCSCALMLQALFSYTVYDHTNAFVSAAVISVVLTAIFLLGQKDYRFQARSDYFSILGIWFIFLVYGFGASIHINCLFDNSVPKYFSPTIVEKSTHFDNRRTTYHFVVSPWITNLATNERIDKKEISVSKKLYPDCEIGDKVDVYVFAGRLRIPWFVTTKYKPALTETAQEHQKDTP